MVGGTPRFFIRFRSVCRYIHSGDEEVEGLCGGWWGSMQSLNLNVENVYLEGCLFPLLFVNVNVNVHACK